MNIKVINKSKNRLPKYETAGSAGMDLRANLKEPIEIEPLSTVVIPTGLYMQLPKGTEGQIRARSGLAIKKGLTMINGVGTIDSDYRGELKIGMVNLSLEKRVIKNGDRVAQLVLAEYKQATLTPTTQPLEGTVRGEGGIGHTGVK